MTTLTARRPRQPLPTNLLHPPTISKSDYLALTEETYRLRLKKKKKSRGRRGGKNTKKRPFYYRPQKDRDQLRFTIENEQLESAKKHKPEFEWINIADTPAEKFNLRLGELGKEDINNETIQSRELTMFDFMPVYAEFLDWCKQLPSNVIIYGNPRLACPLFQGILQTLGMAGEIVLRVNLFLFAHKAEDFFFTQDGQGFAAVGNQLARLNISAPFNPGELAECQICSEEFPRMDFVGEDHDNSVSGCVSCGALVCAECQHKNLFSILQPKIVKKRNNAECITTHSIHFKEPTDGTCAFCRQGFWTACNPNHIPKTYLTRFKNLVAKKNGDTKRYTDESGAEAVKRLLGQIFE